MRITPDILARRIMQQLLLQERMIPIEMQITPRESGVIGELYGSDLYSLRRMTPLTHRVTLRDMVYD